jgi:hypothetical protein
MSSVIMGSKELVANTSLIRAMISGVVNVARNGKKGRGWANLLDHINWEHLDTVEEAKSSSQSTATSFFAKKMLTFSTGSNGLPKTCCLLVSVKKATLGFIANLIQFRWKFVKDYMGKLTNLVEEKIKKILPNQFAVAFDGWTESSTHYLAVFAISLLSATIWIQ